jgi:hypothetical protein
VPTRSRARRFASLCAWKDFRAFMGKLMPFQLDRPKRSLRLSTFEFLKALSEKE